MKSKIFQKKDGNKPSAFEHDVSLKDAKSIKVELSSFVYNDFNPDSDESVYWYELAAENGDVDAQFLLAKILFNKGFIEDSERWFKSARKAGDKEAVKELKKIKEIKESGINENYKY